MNPTTDLGNAAGSEPQALGLEDLKDPQQHSFVSSRDLGKVYRFPTH